MWLSAKRRSLKPKNRGGKHNGDYGCIAVGNVVSLLVLIFARTFTYILLIMLVGNR
jgi:hypothetical protein